MNRAFPSAMDDFLIRAILGGLGIAIMAAPIGCFVVWRKMAYFGEALAHSALLGIALGLILGLSTSLMTSIVGIIIAIALYLLERQRFISGDTILGLLSHTTLSIGLVVIAFTQGLRMDLFGFLFGDILSITTSDILWIYAVGALTLGIMAWLWEPLLYLTVNEDMAHAEGIPVDFIKIVFLILIAIVIASAMKIIGILLITSLLIIPAATARRPASSPEQMVLYAGLLGILAVMAGLGASITWDTPTGPSIVIAAALIFILQQLLYWTYTSIKGTLN